MELRERFETQIEALNLPEADPVPLANEEHWNIIVISLRLV